MREQADFLQDLSDSLKAARKEVDEAQDAPPPKRAASGRKSGAAATKAAAKTADTNEGKSLADS